MKTIESAPLTRCGKPVCCGICGGQRFKSREALLNTRGLTFLKLDWANRKAQLYVCEGCGNVLWFIET